MTQARARKPAKEAYKNLQSILRSRTLRLGSYMESVRVEIPKRRRFNRETGKYEIRDKHSVAIDSAAVCCLADILCVSNSQFSR